MVNGQQVERFWYHVPREPSIDKTIDVQLLGSPGHHYTSLDVVYATKDLIRRRVEQGRLTFDQEKAEQEGYCLLEETNAAEIEFANTPPDFHSMRTKMHVRANIGSEELEKRLQQAGFTKGLPTRY